MSAMESVNKRLASSLRIKLFQNRRSESEPAGIGYTDTRLKDMEMTSKIPESKDSGLDSSENINLSYNSETNFGVNGTGVGKLSPASTSPTKLSLDKKLYNELQNNHLGIPSPGSLVHASPKSMTRSLSTRISNEYNPGSSSPRIKKLIRPVSLCIGNEFFGDSVSVINVPTGNTNPHNEHAEKSPSLSVMMSAIYAVFLLIFGSIISINDQHRTHKVFSEVFSTIISLMGLLWLVIFHVDLYLYKNTVLQELKKRENAMQEQSDRYSVATELIINSGLEFSTANDKEENNKISSPPYRFLLGRHSGSFYLKIGSACFCFGYLVYQGLQLGQHIINFMDNHKSLLKCSNVSSVILHVVSPIYAFYQLFITFKYSNIVINRHKALARFGLMHIIATCMCNWFSTIVDEAVEDYTHTTTNETNYSFEIGNFIMTVERKQVLVGNPFNCSVNSILSTRSMSAIPYLYPFAIEFNLLLAGVWFIVWQNIGKEHTHANPHHLRHTISQDEIGSEAIAYESNLTINADCHSANKGLFLGLFLLLTVVCTVIVFFVAMTTDGYESQAVSLHTAQEGTLTLIGLLFVIASIFQIKKLDRSEHPITFLDDVLLFVPLPFFFIHGIMSIMAEISNQNYTRLGLHILVTLQVVIQTPFIIDGLRRCSNAQALRYKKPGRELVTFLIILNLALWIVNTFELKSVEHFHGQGEFFGELIWLFIGHSTIPLMLFYRFHSSVCLADMWKSAYEKEL